jgi:histidinol dehydrogenase
MESDRLSRAWDQLDTSIQEAFKTAENRIQRYQSAIRPGSQVISDGDGLLGEIVRPMDSVGCYIPGGRFPLPSTVFMTAYIAELAGVEKIVVCTPPASEGDPDSTILAALSRLASVEVHTIGGAQAIAAMAFGTGPVSSVDLIAGPGNLYVTLAKKEVFGQVGVDLLAGPSEITVVATSSASDPEWVAADLLSQAEHDPQARCFLLTPDKEFIEKVDEQLVACLERHPNPDPVSTALNHSGLIHTRSIEEAISISNEIAPEHLELHLHNAHKWVRDCRNAGAIFCGAKSPEPVGDYVAGPSHTLPTRAGARFFSPLSIKTFMKSQSLISMGDETFERVGQYGETFAEIESLWGHEHSLDVRADRKETD